MFTASHLPASTATESAWPTLFFLHFLGGSARTWDLVTPWLVTRFHCRAIDLPGFGGAGSAPGYGVSDMADAVARSVRAEAPARWYLVGHSMGAKVATVLARRAEDGEDGLGGLSGLVLLAGSPPSPEPIAEQRRRTMMGWFSGPPATSRMQASGFIKAGLGEPLPPAVLDRAVIEVLRARRPAWVAWLEGGSREDWSDRVGVLQTPALIAAGGNDDDLGPAAQSDLMERHFATARLVTLAGAGHLLPLERAEDVARLILEHVEVRSEQATTTIPGLDEHYAALLASDRVSARTRAILHARCNPEPGPPTTLTDELFTVLRAAVGRVIPQPAESCIDIAAMIDADLATGSGDGWRFALLPPDADAYRAGLLTLDGASRAAYGHPYAMLEGTKQDSLLERAARGDLANKTEPQRGPLLSARQMQLWFEDLRADAVKIYVAHPTTLDRIGYSGIANGGDGLRKQGFVMGPSGREGWEPVATAEHTS